MKLKAKYEKKEDVPAAVLDFYEEKDGVWVLDADLPPPPDNTSIRKDLQTERQRRQDLEKKIERWEKLGKTDEEIQELIAKAEERELTDAEKKGEWDKLKTQMVEKHTTEINRLTKKIGDLEGTVSNKDKVIHTLTVDTAAAAAIAEHKGRQKLLMPFVKDRIKVVEGEDGTISLQVLDEDKKTPKVNGKGEPMSVIELVAEMRTNEDYGSLFESSGSSGGGTPPGGGGGGKAHQFKRKADFKDERERAEFVDTHGIDEYQKLPA
jgi:hypothetical protein